MENTISDPHKSCTVHFFRIQFVIGIFFVASVRTTIVITMVTVDIVGAFMSLKPENIL